MEKENIEQFTINDLIERIKELEERIDALEKHDEKIDESSHGGNDRPKTSDVLSTPVECEICHKMYKNKYILATHMNNIHSNGRELFECPYCKKKLKSKYYLNKHIHSFHEENEVKHNPDIEETINSLISDNTTDV